MRQYGHGNLDSEIALVGEAYGAQEEKAGKPFVGKSGFELDRLLHIVGLNRDEMYVTNVINERPPNNNFKVYYDKGTPTAELADAYRGLREELSTLPNLKKIVCLGAEATKALTGKGTELYGYWEQTPEGWWVLPTYHPATIFRGAKIKDTDGKTITYNTRQIIGWHFSKALTSPEHEKFHTSIWTNDTTLLKGLPVNMWPKTTAVDIEVINKKITCIGFTFDERTGICVDLREEFQAPMRINALKELLEDDSVIKIFHMADYDIPRIEIDLGWKVRNFTDAMVIQKTLFPDMPKSLKFCAGMWCNLPYWKDDLKQATNTSKDKEIDWKKLFEYNCLDVIATHKIYLQQLKYAGDKYLQIQTDKALMEATMHDIILPGVTVDFDAMKKDLYGEGDKKGLKDLQANRKGELDALFGCNINSPQQLVKYAENAGLLHEKKHELKGKVKVKRTATGRIQMNKETLEKLGAIDERFAAINVWKAQNKLLTTYYKTTTDPDGKWHCGFNVLTDTGRFRSTSSPWGNGYNLQNVPPQVRRYFIPRPGWRFCSVDLKSGDNTIFAALIGDDAELALIFSGKDVHGSHAAELFGTSIDEILEQDESMKKAGTKNKSWRQVTKKFWHSDNYVATYVSIAQTLGCTRLEAKSFQQRKDELHPQTKAYHRYVKKKLHCDGFLVTPYGRRRDFVLAEGEKFLPEAVAYVPQSTCTATLNKGWMRLREWYPYPKYSIRAVNQEHDGMLLEFDPTIYPDEHMREIVETAFVFDQEIACPLDERIRTIAIPVEIKFGNNWSEV